MSKQLFVTFSPTKHDDTAFPGSMDAEQQLESFEFLFFCHSTTVPEFDELGVGRLLHVDVIELDVSQIKLHDCCGELDDRKMSLAASLGKDSYNS